MGYEKTSLVWQYFSKWRKEWVCFKQQPTSQGELSEMIRYSYELRQIRVDQLVYEQDLPESLTDKEYKDWFSKSCIVDGVRMGEKTLITRFGGFFRQKS